MEIRHRRFQETDIDDINALYQAVTGRIRNPDLFRWQWLTAPGGEGEMWVIEGIEKSGETRLIGHHGLMPLYFSAGEATLLAGKTENTMVHPDYRRKILYPRFEKRFLDQYASRFDLLFSTTGPKAALRQRTALGYQSDRTWIRYDWRLKPGAVAARIATGLQQSKRSQRSTSFRIAEAMLRRSAQVGGLFSAKKPFGSVLTLRELNASEAQGSSFFDDLWTQARHDYPLTPQRSGADLSWRYWQNPYNNYITLTTESDSPLQGYAIINKEDPLMFSLDDIVCTPYTEADFNHLLRSVCTWCAHAGASVLSFMTTNDPISPAHYIENSGLVDVKTRWPLSKRQETRFPMLRKVTDRGQLARGQTDNWYITPFVFEGRN